MGRILISGASSPAETCRRASKVSSPPEGLPPFSLEVLDLLAERLDAVLHLQSFRQVPQPPPAERRDGLQARERGVGDWRSRLRDTGRPRPARRELLRPDLGEVLLLELRERARWACASKACIASRMVFRSRRRYARSFFQFLSSSPGP